MSFKMLHCKPFISVANNLVNVLVKPLCSYVRFFFHTVESLLGLYHGGRIVYFAQFGFVFRVMDVLFKGCYFNELVRLINYKSSYLQK